MQTRPAIHPDMETADYEFYGYAEKLRDDRRNPKQVEYLKKKGYQPDAKGRVIVNQGKIAAQINRDVDQRVRLGISKEDEVLRPGRVVRNWSNPEDIHVVSFQEPFPKGYVDLKSDLVPSEIFWQAIDEKGLYPLGDPSIETRAGIGNTIYMISDALTHDLSHFGSFDDHNYSKAVRILAKKRRTLSPEEIEKRRGLHFIFMESFQLYESGSEARIDQVIKDFGLKPRTATPGTQLSYNQYFEALAGKSIDQLKEMYDKLIEASQEINYGGNARDPLVVYVDKVVRSREFFGSQKYVRELAKEQGLLDYLIANREALAYALAHADAFKGMTAADIVSDMNATNFKQTVTGRFYCGQRFLSGACF